MNANEFVSLISKLSKEGKPYSLGTIDPAFNGKGTPKVIFDGETTPSLKGYSFIGFTPQPNDRVILSNIGGTNVILGRVETDGGWKALTLASPWTDYSATAWTRCGYEKVGNLVKVSGMVKTTSTLSATSTIATLPVGFRPPSGRTFLFTGTYNKAGAGLGDVGAGQVSVYSDGTIKFATYQATPVGWLSLDNIIFSVSEMD